MNTKPKNKTIKALSLLLCMVMLFGLIPSSAFAASLEPSQNREFTITVIGGTGSFRDRNEVFSGTADADDVLRIVYSEAEGRTFKHWATPEGTTISDKTFYHMVTGNMIFFAVYADSGDYTYSEWTLVESGDCEEGSLYRRENTAGDVEYERTYPNGGYHTYDDECTNIDDTYHKRVCTVCGHENQEEHSWNSGKITQEATHGSFGTKTYSCYNCDATKTESIAKTEEHVFGDWEIVEPSVNGEYGKRRRTCLYCDYSETYWYLAPHFENLLEGNYVSTERKSGSQVTREEQYYNYLDENGSRVHLWATKRPGKDSDRTYIFAFIDDGNPEVLKPIYLSKTQDAAATNMPHYEWAVISYAYNADDWYKILEIPDMILGVVGPAPSFGNGLSENASGLFAMHDLWSDEYNNMMIPVTEDPDSFLDASQSIYSNNGEGTMLGDRETIEYRKNSSPFLDYFTVDKATGVTLAFRYTLTYESGSFTSQKAIISASDFNALTDDEKLLKFDVSTIEETLKNFSKDYYHAFSLVVPESTHAFRVVCSDDNTTVSGNYTRVLVNPSRVYPISVPEVYDGTITLEWEPGNDYIFDRWEVYDFTTHTWTTIPLTPLTDPEAPPTAKLNTPDNPLTDIAYIRCIKHEAPPVMCQVKVNSGTFTISGDTEHYSDAPVPYGTIISLSNIDIDNKTCDHWVDKDGNTVESYWNLQITGDEEFTSIYADSIYTINVSAYNEHGSVWQVGNDKSKGTSCICRGTAGTVASLSTSGDPDNGFTEFLGWYLVQYTKSGVAYSLLSKTVDLSYTITNDRSLSAVWTDGTVSMEPQPVLVKVTGGFVGINIAAGSAAWGENPRMLYVSSADFYGERESIMVIDDTKDDLYVGSWRVDWVSPEGDQSDTYNQVPDLNMSLESADDYSEHLVTITGVQVPSCATHTWDKGVVTTAATHTTEGVMTYTCTVCGATKTQAIAKTTEHVYGNWTPSNDGENHERRCDCGESEKAAHTWGAGVATTAATHTAEGVMTYTCTVCGATKTEPIAKTTEHVYGNWTPSNDGENHERRCDCGESEKAAHTWGAGVVTTAATHTTEGVMTYTCTVCGATKTEPIAKTTEHAYGEWTPSNDGENHERRCDCGESEKAAHTWGAGVVTTVATHTTEGVMTYTCTVCGATKTEPIAKTTEHSFGRWFSSNDSINHERTCACGEATEKQPHAWNEGTVRTPATHTAEGVMYYTCTVCGAGKTGPIAKTTEHEFGEWIRTGNDTMQRICPCGKTETKQIKAKAETLPATSDGITVNIGTDTSIPAGTVVNTENLTEKMTEDEKKTLRSAIELVLTNENGEEFVSLFNISLEFEGSKIQPDGTVKVELPIPENAAKAYKSFKVVYIDDAGVAHEMPTEMKDGKVIFTTDHFSQYAIVGIERVEEHTDSTAGIERVKAADSGDSMQIWVWMLVGTLAGVAFVAVSVCIMRRKNRAN